MRRPRRATAAASRRSRWRPGWTLVELLLGLAHRRAARRSRAALLWRLDRRLSGSQPRTASRGHDEHRARRGDQARSPRQPLQVGRPAQCVRPEAGKPATSFTSTRIATAASTSARSRCASRGRRRSGITIRGNRPVDDYVSYTSLGSARLLNGALQMGTFTVCKSGRRAIDVVLANSGRARIQKTAVVCP